MKKTKYVVLGLFTIAFFFILIKCCISPGISFLEQETISKEEFESRKEAALEDYLGIFKKDFQINLGLSHTKIVKNKFPVMSFKYKKDINLIVHKVKCTKSEARINRLVFTEEKKTINSSSDVAYTGYDLTNTNFRLSYEGDSIVESVYVSYDNRVLQQNTNDSSYVCHSLLASGFSIRYEKEGVVDFYLKTVKSNVFENAPMVLKINTLVYRRGDDVFIVVAFAKNSVKIDNSFLLEACSLR